MAILQKLDILSARDRKQETVDVPEWGGEVIVSELGAADYMAIWGNPEFSKDDGKTVDMSKFAPALVARCIVDETGGRIFNDDDTASLASKSSIPFGRVATVALRLNGFLAQEEEIKKSMPSPSDDSSIGSA